MTEPARQDVQIAEAAPPPAENPTVILQMIERAALNPEVDVDKMERLLAMQERVMERQAKASFNSALAEMQPRLPVIDENGGIKNNSGVVQSTYATWEDINDAVRPLLHEYGFALTFRPGVAGDGKQTVTAILRHREGHEEDATVTLPYDSSGNKNSVQAVGSSLTYGKRYSAIAVLNITSRAREDRDDDGKAAGLGKACQHAISEINMCEDLATLRKWKADKFDGVSRILAPNELREVIALYNRRLKALRGEAPANG